MIQDLHSHTYYSFCGTDSPETLVETAFHGGIEMLGITDHNYGIAFANIVAHQVPEAYLPLTYDKRVLRRYYDHVSLIKEKYADRICILRGIEVATRGDCKLALPEDADISFFDYCLLEHLDHELSVTGGDLFAYAKRCGCSYVGVAHTDLFAHIQKCGEDPYTYFRRMAEGNIFWEMNVSYDSIHQYRVHTYMLDFFSDPQKQEIVRRSGARISIGFDGHNVVDYLPERIREYCNRLTALGIKMPFEESDAGQ